MDPYIAYFDITLAAYETRAVAVSGARIFVRSSDAQFFVNFDGSSTDLPVEQGFSIGTPDGSAFRQIVFKNTTSTANRVTGYIGSNTVDYAPPVEQINLSVKNAATVLKPSGLLSLATLTADTYAGTLNGKNRKQIIVTNLSATADLYIRDTNDATGAVVMPRTPWTMETSAAVKVYNPSGLSVSYTVLEIFYT